MMKNGKKQAKEERKNKWEKKGSAGQQQVMDGVPQNCSAEVGTEMVSVRLE